MHYDAICHFNVHFVLPNFWMLFVQKRLMMKEQITKYIIQKDFLMYLRT